MLQPCNCLTQSFNGGYKFSHGSLLCIVLQGKMNKNLKNFLSKKFIVPNIKGLNCKGAKNSEKKINIESRKMKTCFAHFTKWGQNMSQNTGRPRRQKQLNFKRPKFPQSKYQIISLTCKVAEHNSKAMYLNCLSCSMQKQRITLGCWSDSLSKQTSLSATVKHSGSSRFTAT